MKKKIALASDHAGFELKENIKNYLAKKGYETVDLGPDTDKVSISYASQGNKLADYVVDNDVDFGVAVCGTGLGISYALNRHKHIRAARVASVEDAHLAKLHNDANVLCFGGRQIEKEKAFEMIDDYINTKYEGGRHQTRIDELDQ
ncbi:RpiB/LacA/LacB family sugar-phosphate isomerase [Mycoplasma crocodyli]|uniref:Ribose-5-phosphate isomerase B (Phosphoriboisomerase B) n=1 Tax=Mycoplasma crocodyli (strain ATCC 51981 / MP145) TaxID=512564 RepID=D5E4U8_MYCCM|nr:RpiB/LacA/LacB family sugar-phosphate isomerase [Mycoplasma crocodyli]ADE20033.1 ribose-5-phosphate isomerase B (Phosphoriboisomerase B) [Mycoplasma crocodyli MP145]